MNIVKGMQTNLRGKQRKKVGGLFCCSLEFYSIDHMHVAKKVCLNSGPE